ncbi:hypothetical protein AB0H49_09550 [Nocardia sp. NPDC050713]|uniref:hypothetical protein n=1 Tax=Nocardia sp. NPDC050713 TaxID=3154511 RepID=UPI0033FA23FA
MTGGPHTRDQLDHLEVGLELGPQKTEQAVRFDGAPAFGQSLGEHLFELFVAEMARLELGEGGMDHLVGGEQAQRQIRIHTDARAESAESGEHARGEHSAEVDENRPAPLDFDDGWPHPRPPDAKRDAW